MFYIVRWKCVVDLYISCCSVFLWKLSRGQCLDKFQKNYSLKTKLLAMGRPFYGLLCLTSDLGRDHYRPFVISD